MVETEDHEVFHGVVSPKKWQESNTHDIATNWLPEQDSNNPSANRHDNVEGEFSWTPLHDLELQVASDSWEREN